MKTSAQRPLRYAFQMDPLSGLNFSTDSTWQLIKEAHLRGEAYYFSPKDLFWKNGDLFANSQKIHITKDGYKLDNVELLLLKQLDVIFIRQDPPYDMNYLTSTYLLEKISDQVLILNDPTAIRNFPEKISVLDYPEFIPPTLITSSKTEALKFAQDYDKVILKPLYSYAGTDIFCLKHDDDKFFTIIEQLLNIHKTPFIVQKFIPEITSGDKRIILVDGKAVGGYTRLPEANNFVANAACGGQTIPTELTDIDKKICAALAPMLIKNNLFLVGIDVIAGYLTEINVTSPTGIVTIEQFSCQKITKSIFDIINDKKLTKNPRKN